jgi:site-specific DNA recombinase
LLRCGNCGETYQLETSGKRNRAGQALHRYYNCRTACRAGREACRGFRVRTDVLDRTVLNHLGDDLFTVERCQAILRDVIGSESEQRQRLGEARRGLEARRADLDRRIAQWCEAFEAGDDLAQLGADRLRALREGREDVERQLAATAMASPAPLPPYLFKPEVVERFRKRLKATLRDPETGVAREYLRRLVDRIVIRDGDVVVEGKASAAAAPMAESRGGPAVLTTTTKVRTHVVGWRPNPDTSTNFWSRFRVDGTRRRASPRAAPTEPQRIVRLLAQGGGGRGCSARVGSSRGPGSRARRRCRRCGRRRF